MPTTTTIPTVRAAHVFYVETQLKEHAVLKNQLGPKDAEIARRDGSKDTVHQLSFKTAERILASGKDPNRLSAAEVQDIARQIVDEGSASAPAVAVAAAAAASAVVTPPAPAAAPAPAPAPAAAAAAPAEAPVAKKRAPRKVAAAPSAGSTAPATEPAAPVTTTSATTAAATGTSVAPANRFAGVSDSDLVEEVKRRSLNGGALSSPLLPAVTLLEATIFFLEQQGRTSPGLEAVRKLAKEYREEIFA